MKKTLFALFVLVGCFMTGAFAEAQSAQGLALSISPPLYKVNLNPGEAWGSVVKVINNNPYEMMVYAQVLDFKSGEQGGVEFIKNNLSDQATSTDKFALSQWVNITSEPVRIPAFGSQDVQFTIATPANASPGGHYAAIMVGTEPPDNTGGGSNIKVSSKLASLILARVSGDVIEKGDIKEFSVGKSVSADLKADFNVIFENSGNTHLQPKGEISITNIFGQKRATIMVNNQADYGNVLPNSVKRWQFNWQGDSSLFDAGLMKADLLMTYGGDTKESLVRTIYFWTFSMKPTLIVLGVIIIPLLLIIFIIRLYIRRSINNLREQAMIRPSRGRPRR
ncbi:MAG: hypothetical protein WCG01_02775 [bacterium]